MTDDELLARIAHAFDHDLEPVPDRLLAAADEAFEWRRADAELADLLFDSARDELTGVRGAATERRAFRFAAGEYSLRIHLTADTMVVMLEPPLSVACRIVADDGTTEHRTDELGELAVDAPALPLRVEVELPGGAVVTPWITG